LADDEPAQHRRDREAQPERRADHAVGLVTPVFGHEQGDERRHRDRPQVADHRAGEDQRHEDPEVEVAQAEQMLAVDDRVLHQRRAVQHERADRREHQRAALAVTIDERAEHHPEQRREHGESATDHRRGQHRFGLEIHPERDREPQEAVHHAADQGVDEQLVERAHGARR
jgi:hypothetical protein